MLKFLYFACVLFLSLGQLVTLSKGALANIYVFDIATGFFALIGILYLLVRCSFTVPKFFLPFVAFTIFALFTILFSLRMYSFADTVPGIFYFARLAVYVSAGVVLYNIVRLGLITKGDVENYIVASAIFVCISGFVQLYVLPDFEQLNPLLGWDPHKNRLASTFFDPNFTGAYLCAAFAILLDKVLSKQSKITYLLALAVISISLLLTFSRSAWASAGVVIFIYGLFKRRWFLYLSLLVVFFAYFAVPRVQTRLSGITDPSDSAHFRFVSWGNSVKIISNNWLFGVGYNNYKLAQLDMGFINYDTVNSHSASGTDSSLLYVLATTGVFGLLIYTFGVGYPIFTNLLNKTKRYLPMQAFICAMLVGSLFINSLFFPQIMFVWFTMLAIGQTFDNQQ